MSTPWIYGPLIQGGSDVLLPKFLLPNTIVSVNTFGSDPPNDNGHLVLKDNVLNIITEYNNIIFTSTLYPPTVTYNYPTTGSLFISDTNTFGSYMIFNAGLRLEITAVSITFRRFELLETTSYSSNSAFGTHYSTYMHIIDLPDFFGIPSVSHSLTSSQWTSNNSFGVPFTMGSGFSIELDWVAFEYSYASYDLRPIEHQDGDIFGSQSLWPSSSFGPIEDITLGTWTNELDSNVDIYTSIDEQPTANNYDYIKSAYLTPSANDVYETRLPPVKDPLTSNNHYINYTIQSHTIDGTKANLTVTLLQNTTVIAQWVHIDVPEVYQNVSQSLSNTEIDSITNYGDLRIRFEASS